MTDPGRPSPSPDPLYVDPRTRDARYPDRPTHQDFVDLSETAQEVDHAADLGTLTNPLDALGLDEESLMYFLTNRLAIFGIRTQGAVDLNPATMALYLDALTVGKRLAERRAARPDSEFHCEVCGSDDHDALGHGTSTQHS